jgi:hypothetical protein
MKKLVVLASLQTGRGNNGAAGLSAYQLWLMQPGNSGKSLLKFFDSLKGDKGDPGDSVFKTWLSIAGNEDRDKSEFLEEMRGIAGMSAYEAWLLLPGNEGKSQAMFYESLKGEPGEAGMSFFELWLTQPGNQNKSYEDLLEELKGEKGDPGDKGEKGAQGDPGFTGADGKSAYQVWLEEGNSGTEADFIASLKGIKGDKGDPGKNGTAGESAYKTVPDLSLETAALYDEATLAYYPVGKVYFGTTYKHFVIRTIGTVKRFVPLGITFIGTDDNGINVFDPATEQYILVRTWETLVGPQGKSPYDLWKEAGNEGTEADYLASLKGKDGENGKDGTSGQSAFELWKAQEGNEEKTMEDYWQFLANLEGGFSYNLALDTDTSILFSSPKDITINRLSLFYADTLSYSLNGGAATAVTPGEVSITIAANSVVKFNIAYTAGKTQAIISISGIYN